jgi:hypothetical protein
MHAQNDKVTNFFISLLKNKSVLLAVQKGTLRRVDHSPGMAAIGPWQ